MTLVELMVGITVGLVVTTALLLLFANASTNGQNLMRSSVQIENGRYVAELLREDLRLAGFYGELPDPTATAYTYPSPCLTTPTGLANPSASHPADLTSVDLPSPIQGFKTGEAVACLANRKSGTAALALRHLSTTPVAAAAVTSPQYYVQVSFCPTEPPAPLLIFDKTSASFTLKTLDCTAANQVRAYVSRAYYVADCNVCSPSDGIPTLKRVDLVGSTLVTTALAEGVEHLRFEYGFDTDADGAPDTYLADADAPAAAGEASKWENVMAVRAHFITRSLEKVVGGPTTGTVGAFQLGSVASVDDPGDRYARRVYSTTVRLMNPSGARE